MEILELVKKASERDLSDYPALEDYFEVVRLLGKENPDEAHKHSKEITKITGRYAREKLDVRFMDLQRKSLLFDSPVDFDSYCRFIEWDRVPERRFYMPRRKQLLPLVQALQELETGDLELLGISLPPGVGKSSISLFYLTWLAGRDPSTPILGGSHSNAFLRGAYDECNRILDNEGEYLWNSVFPGVNVINTNAKDLCIDLGEGQKDRKRFPTLEFTSVGAGNAGKVRAGHLLYCDDLCSGIEEALSRDRMDKLWELYTTDLRQRKIGDCKELHVATRWSVHDVIGRLERKYDGDSRALFIRVPALNEEDESNFTYSGKVGFSTEFYHDMRATMDDASWRALYMNEPIEREGQLYSDEELRRYFELPDGEPDAIISVCDTKDKGSDYCVMPIAYVYGNDYYIDDFVCDNGKPNIVEERLACKLVEHSVGMSRFESNSAGGKIAEKVQKTVKGRGGKTKITTKYTTSNKETKIVVESTWVKEHCLFKDDSVIKKDKEYKRAMSFLTGYTMSGKNAHDDVPDAMAMFSQFAQSLAGGGTKVVNRPW